MATAWSGHAGIKWLHAHEDVGMALRCASIYMHAFRKHCCRMTFFPDRANLQGRNNRIPILSVAYQRPTAATAAHASYNTAISIARGHDFANIDDESRSARRHD